MFLPSGAKEYTSGLHSFVLRYMRGIMPRKSTDITAKYTNSFCKLIFVEWAIGLIVYILAIALSINHSVSLPIGSAIMFLSYNILFTSMHAAGHGHFSRNISKYKWMDRVIGEVSANLIQVSYKFWTNRHNEHHQHTNVRDMDPDFLPNFKSRKLFSYVILATLMRAVFAIPFLGKITFKKMPSKIREPWESRKTKKLFIHTDNKTRTTYAIILTTILSGYGAYGFWLVFLPFLLHSYAMVIIFMWLPHRSRKSSKYKDTRDQITPLLNRTVLFIGADFHLEHHLYPSVPCPHLRKLHFEILDELDENKAVCVGRFTGKPLKLRSR
jgi:fatty acid desaturase